MKKLKTLTHITISVIIIIIIIFITKPTEYKTTKVNNKLEKMTLDEQTTLADLEKITNSTREIKLSKVSEPDFKAEQSTIINKSYNEDTTNTEIFIEEQPQEIIEVEEEIKEESIPENQEILKPLTPQENIPQEESNDNDQEKKSNQENYNIKELIEINTNSNNQWKLFYLEDNTYKIASVEDENLVLQTTKEGSTPIIIEEFTNTSHQLWNIEKTNVGYNIVSKETSLCLNIENTPQLEECDQSNQYQNFTLEVIEKEPQYQNKYYTIKSNTDTSKILNIKTNNKSHLWQLISLSNGYYKIVSASNPNKSLTIEDNHTIKYNIYQEQDNQKWQIINNQDQTVFISSISNMCLTIQNNNIEVSPCIESENQKFILEEYPENLTYYGIDISDYQGDINWQEVAQSDVEFVIIRAGFGDNWTSQDDQKLIANIQGCEEYQIPYGLYLYSYAVNLEGPANLEENSISTSSEIAHIKRILKQLEELNYRPTLKTTVFYDLEDESTIYLGKEKLTTMADYFCKNLESNNYNCGIYANKYWLTTNLNASYLAEKYDIWLAEWPDGVSTYEQTITISPSYNITDYNYWQFSSTGSIPGITGNVDLDIGYDIFLK